MVLIFSRQSPCTLLNKSIKTNPLFLTPLSTHPVTLMCDETTLISTPKSTTERYSNINSNGLIRLLKLPFSNVILRFYLTPMCGNKRIFRSVARIPLPRRLSVFRFPHLEPSIVFPTPPRPASLPSPLCS